MNKKLPIFLAVLLMVSLTIPLSGCGLRLYESEYFIYTVNSSKKISGILGLTDKGREQEYLVIPETIEDNKVTEIRYWKYAEEKITQKYGDSKNSGFQSDCLKKVFIIPEIRVYNGDSFFDLTKGLSVFYISNDTYVQENINHYFYYYTNVNDASSFTRAVRNHKANVSYFYNYETAPNDGYYWIDNYVYGEKISHIAQNPSRNGYVFYGWYKEPECVNLWDFEIDRLPEPQYNEEGEDIYQETKLYAKWIKN